MPVAPVLIEPTAAAAVGLAPVRIAIDPSGGIAPGAVLSDGAYFVLSGPPGGPLGIALEAAPRLVPTEAGLRAFAEERFATRGDLSLGAFERVDVAGGAHPSLALTCGQSLARSHHLLTAITNGEATLLLLAHTGANGGQPTPTPSELRAGLRLKETLDSLTIG